MEVLFNRTLDLRYNALFTRITSNLASTTAASTFHLSTHCLLSSFQMRSKANQNR